MCPEPIENVIPQRRRRKPHVRSMESRPRLNPDVRLELLAMANGSEPRTPAALRAQVLLLTTEGLREDQISKRLGISHYKVRAVLSLYKEQGVAALRDTPWRKPHAPRARAVNQRLTTKIRKQLNRMAAGPDPLSPVALRAQVVLLAAENESDLKISKRLKIAFRTARRVVEMFMNGGIDELIRRPSARQKPYPALKLSDADRLALRRMTADRLRLSHALRARILLQSASGPWTPTGICRQISNPGAHFVMSAISHFREEGVAGLRNLPDGALRRASPYRLKAGDATFLRSLLKDNATPFRIARRARAVLAANAMSTDSAIAAAEGVGLGHVRSWLERYRKGGVPQLCRLIVHQRQRGPGMPAFRLTPYQARALQRLANSALSLTAKRARAVLAAANNPFSVKAVTQASGMGYDGARNAVQLFLASIR